ncbi:DUF2291 domain-containing protein [Thioclava sp. BHET1]|nr:DUF2291 domain-containing protein [Thioclava sp. BHET1]
MFRTLAAGCCLLLSLTALSGCKIVKDPDPAAVAQKGPQGDAERMEALAKTLYAPKVVPFVKDHATDIATLRAAIAKGLEAAGKSYGFRPASGSSPWNFIAKGQGKVVAARLDSRAATMGLDTDGDGKADVTIQLGPVMRGTALRDAMPFIDFTNFRDQIEFAKLARALNDAAHAAMVPPKGDPAGTTWRFEGIFTLRKADEAILLTPTELEQVP